MKKVFYSIISIILLIFLSACQNTYEVEYSDNQPFQIEMKGDSLKILQLTDLHLSYGIDYRDRKTFQLITKLSKYDDYDLIVITGDLTMSPQAPMLFNKLINHMESLAIPWTFVFGNHETDFNNYGDFLKLINNTEYLYFKVGPKITDGGYGNFKIEFTKDGLPFYNAYFLDSKAERDTYTEEEGVYDYLSYEQVAWYEEHVSLDAVDSLVFMHIPLRQYINPIQYTGIFEEKMVYAQGVDTGFFDAMVTFGKSKAVFVGHDHLNDFSFVLNDIYLAYGRATGFNGYGYLERGGRHIEMNASSELDSYILLESEMIP
ncbi:metallophosphoesterase [Peloplasma aerotolerans]|uniref:Metallophosphoesterase n=1 Tax=Peloplasma aerotolerans TaxID=3044389 RepID=A0AAW6UAQ0_9MOLU|nr:metallophosphoesterase [Mariniplasma sp. M4Ah]MDI6453176.1 metallophosphoesterase [Mariniplasma sp. M4Ah]